MSFRIFAFAAAGAAMLLSACETAEGYRQQMVTWQGRSADDLAIQWGPPADRSSLSDGRELWVYSKTTVTTSEGYYRDETREVTRTITDKDGKKRTETIQETFPVWQPPQTYRNNCDHRIQQVTFEGNGCVAPEAQS
jgi:hypothetical protein